jgi:hypothetical protein
MARLVRNSGAKALHLAAAHLSTRKAGGLPFSLAFLSEFDPEVPNKRRFEVRRAGSMTPAFRRRRSPQE